MWVSLLFVAAFAFAFCLRYVICLSSHVKSGDMRLPDAFFCLMMIMMMMMMMMMMTADFYFVRFAFFGQTPQRQA
jgi:hypothetical protein